MKSTITLSLCLFALTAQAGTPSHMHYRGQLSDLADQPFNGVVSLVFALYIEPFGGEAIWEERQDEVRSMRA